MLTIQEEEILFELKLSKVLLDKHLSPKIKLFVKDNGPHKSLYTSVYGRDVWLCFLKKYELNILHDIGVNYHASH